MQWHSWIGGRLKLLLLRLLLVFMCSGLAACSTPAPPPVSTAFEMPESFVASVAGAGPALDEPWWQTFGDARLNAFVEHALHGNPALAQALARTRLAEAQTRLQRAERLPQVGINVDASRQKQNFFFDTGEESFRFNLLESRYTPTLAVSWELDMWGRLAALSASARADYLASQQQLRAVQQSLAAQVVQMYFAIVHAQAQVELAQSTVSSLAEMARQVGNRVREGVASPADGLLAQANLDSARAGLQQRLELFARSQRQLEVAMGQYPAGSLATAVALPPLPPTPSAGLPAALLQRRPDVRAAELGLLSAGYQLGAAQRSFLPSLSLNGSAGFSGNQLAGLFSSGNLIWSIAGSVMQPVFQGGRLVAQVDMAGAQRDEALMAYGETALNALAEVETALAVEQVLQQREEALAESAQTAQEAQRVALNRYLQGIEPFLMVLESQQRALDGRSAHLSAHLERLDNRIALYLALGGGFEGAAAADGFSSLATQTPVQETHDE